MSPEDLGLVSTDALLDALFARYDHAVFAGLRQYDDAADWKSSYLWKTATDLMTCSGISNRIAKEIQDRIDEQWDEGSKENN